MRVREIMSGPAVVLAPDLPVKQAAAVLGHHGFTGAPVVDGAGRLVGMVREQDLLADRFPPDPRIPVDDRIDRQPGATVSDVMRRRVSTADPEDAVAELLGMLHESKVRSVPVVEDGVVVGVITYMDLVRAMARDDSLIETDVRRRLALFGQTGRWHVRVRDGEVTLVDNGGDPTDRSAALRLAEAVIGVTRCRIVDGPAR